MRSWRFFAALTILLSPVAASAATVEILVRDDGGRPLEAEAVFLQPDLLAELRPFRAHTDAQGKVLFEGVPVGSYTIEVRGPVRTELVPPHNNPFAAPQRFTLESDTERLRLVVERLRGKTVRTRLDLPDREWAKFGLRFTHLATGKVIVTGFASSQDYAATVLPPGAWRTEVSPPSGYLLKALDVDGMPQPGAYANLELDTAAGQVEVTWSYAAPCILHGKVVASDPLPAIEVEARLVEGGAWLADARQRGGSSYERVRAGAHPLTGHYELKLPDGLWVVQPVGQALLSSEPAEENVRLWPGDLRRVDFAVRLRDRSKLGPLTVSVRGPAGEAVLDALVQIFPLGEAAGPPFASAYTQGGPYAAVASFEGVPAGDLLIVAGHRDYLEGSTTLSGYQPRKPPEPGPQVELGAGARLLFEARDLDGDALAGATLRAELIEASLRVPPARLRDPALAAAKADRSVLTDQTGRARMAGLVAGRYRLSARQAGAGRSFVHLRVAGRPPSPTLEIELSPDQELEIEGQAVPAAYLRLTLACADGWPLPGAFDVRVLPATATLPLDPLGREAPAAAPAFAATAQLPAGRNRDHLEIGPLGADDYRIAVRPAGFDRWTWAFSTHDPAEALVVPIRLERPGSGVAGESIAFDFECGPAIDVLPRIADGATFPPLAQVKLTARLIDRASDQAIAPEPRLLVGGDRVLVRGLEPGEGRLALTLDHPHFLPEPRLAWEIPVDLRLGRFRELLLEVEGLGGALQADTRAGRLAATGADGVRREATASAGRALLLPSLPPGAYQVELAGADGRVLATWRDVAVVAGITRLLEIPP